MRRLGLAVVFVLFVLHAAPAQASHAAGYHWKRPSNPFTVKIIDSATGSWDTALQAAAKKWSNGSDVLDTSFAAGSTTPAARKRCAFATGRAIHVCSASYPDTWAGLTEVTYSVPGNHITSARIRLNSRVAKGLDVRTAVACHELGHGWGLAHRAQSETSSCMTPNVGPAQTHPDAHDFAELATIYSHTDGAAPSGGRTRTVRYVIE